MALSTVKQSPTFQTRNHRSHKQSSRKPIKINPLYPSPKPSPRNKRNKMPKKHQPPKPLSTPPKMELLISSSPSDTDTTTSASNLIHTLLSACHQLDHAICSHTPNEVLEWHALDPFTYLTSEALIERWEEDLGTLCRGYLEGKYVPEVFGRRLEGILPGVEKLEEVRDRWRGEIGREIKEMEVVWKAVERRCGVIDGVLGRLEGVLDGE